MIRKNASHFQKDLPGNNLDCDVEARKKELRPGKKRAGFKCFFIRASALLLFLLLFLVTINNHQNGQYPLMNETMETAIHQENNKQVTTNPEVEDEPASRDAEIARQHVHRKLHNYRNSGINTIGSHEPLLTFLLSSILSEDNGELLPEGNILDCGAQRGEQGAHYAVSSPNRKVIAMDPSPSHVKHMNNTWGSLKNLEIRQGGLGGEVGTMKPRDKYFEMDMDSEFPIYTLDSMYFDKQQLLAFAHIDIEGMEFKALQGGLKTIRANNPVFTVELRVHETEKTKQLLDLINEEGYDTYVIDEPCGWPHIDIRNILCIPRHRSEAFGRSNGFALLLMMEGLKRVTSDDIAQVVLPCCALGGECCPGDNLDDKNCCTEDMVVNWYDKNKGTHRIPPVVLGFKQGRQEFLRQQWRLRQRQGQGKH